MDSQNWLMTSLELGWNISQGLPREGKLFHWAALLSSLRHYRSTSDLITRTQIHSRKMYEDKQWWGTLISQPHLLYTTLHLQEFKTSFFIIYESFQCKNDSEQRRYLWLAYSTWLPTIYISCSQQFVVIFISFNKTLIINCFITIGWRQFATAALVNFTPCNRVCGSEFINKVLPPAEKLFGNFCWDLSDPRRGL